MVTATVTATVEMMMKHVLSKISNSRRIILKNIVTAAARSNSIEQQPTIPQGQNDGDDDDDEGFSTFARKKIKQKINKMKKEDSEPTVKIHVFSDASNWSELRYRETVWKKSHALKLIQKNASEWKWAHFFDTESKRTHDFIKGRPIKGGIRQIDETYMTRLEASLKSSGFGLITS